jgi:hypothetical protein
MGRIAFSEVKQLLQPFLDRGPFCIGDYVNRAITVLSYPCEQFFQEHGGTSFRLSDLQAAQPVFVVLGSGRRLQTIGAILY